MADELVRVSFNQQIIFQTSNPRDLNAEILQMYVNPNKLDFSQMKLTTTSNTIEGFAIEYWGNDLITIRASGLTGSFKQTLQFKRDSSALTRYIIVPEERSPEPDLNADFNPLPEGVMSLTKRRASEAYIRFIQLLNFYRVHPEVTMIYDGLSYEGYFSSFGYTEDATMPLMFSFNFEFVSQSEIKTTQQIDGYDSIFNPSNERLA